MTKAEVIVAIADKTGVDKASVSTTLESFFEIVKVVFGIYHFNIIFRINNNLKNLKKNNLLTKNILLMLSLIVHFYLFFYIYNNVSNIAGISYFLELSFCLKNLLEIFKC